MSYLNYESLLCTKGTSIQAWKNVTKNISGDSFVFVRKLVILPGVSKNIELIKHDLKLIALINNM